MDKLKVQGRITGLALPQTKRLAGFCKTKRTNRDDVVFDDRMYDELMTIVKDRKWLQDTKNYLDSMGFCQSKYDSSLLQSQIEKFCGSNHPYFGWNRNYQQAVKEMKAQVRNALLRPIKYTNKEVFMRALPRKDTHAGFIEFESGKHTKGENAEDIYYNWDSILGEAVKDQSFNVPIIPGIRTQASGAFTDSGEYTHTWKAKSRLVNMYDERPIMGETMFSRPVQDYMSKCISWYAGGKEPMWLRRKILVSKRDFGESVTIDYSSYDQSISNWLIYDAFDIIKSMFRPFSDDEQKVFDTIVNDFINKAFIDINGNILYSNKGVPSGSMFTQIIDSIVNMLMIKTYLISKGISSYDCLIMGDDNVIFTRYPLDLHDLSGYLKHNFGIDMNPAKCSQAGWKVKEVQFLSRTWRDEGEWRTPEVLISKLLYPETFRNYDKWGFTPKHIIKAYFDTFLLGMRELTKPLTERNYFYELDTNCDPSIKNHFLTGLARLQEHERQRGVDNLFIMQHQTAMA